MIFFCCLYIYVQIPIPFCSDLRAPTHQYPPLPLTIFPPASTRSEYVAPTQASTNDRLCYIPQQSELISPCWNRRPQLHERSSRNGVPPNHCLQKSIKDPSLASQDPTEVVLTSHCGLPVVVRRTRVRKDKTSA